MNATKGSLIAGLCAALVLTSACSGRPRDVARARPRSAEDGGSHSVPEPPPPPVAEKPRVKPKVVARATSRVLAVDDTNLYFGDQSDDGVFALSKNAASDPVRLARRAPVAGALAIDGEWLAWIASPGDAVLRLTLMGAGATTLREHGIFSDVAAEGGEVFATEVVAGGGALVKIAGNTVTKIATFESPPRAVVVDATHVYVQLGRGLVRTSRNKGGPIETLFEGTGIESPQLDATHVCIVVRNAESAHAVRIPKAGGPPVPVATDVRAPIEVAGKHLLYFDGQKPQLRQVALTGGASTVLAEDEIFARPAAIVADEAHAFVAVEDGVIVAVPRK